MSEHAKFSPSKMQRIIACPGSVALESALPDSRSSYADEGTVAHDMAARCLRVGKDTIDFIGASADVNPQGAVGWAMAPHTGKFQINQSFADYVQSYVDMVRRLAHGKLLLVEQRVGFSEAAGAEGQFGTADVVIIDTGTGEIWVIDLKFGMGVKVYAEGNEQALTYAAGVLETYAEILPPITKINLVISQPRLDHEDHWECTLADVQNHVRKMHEAVTKAECGLAMYQDNKVVPEVYFAAGDKQCKFCKAKAFCPTLAASVAGAMELDFAAFNTVEGINQVVAGPRPVAPSPALIGARYGMLDLVEEWVKAVRSETERMVFAGMDVIGPDGERMKLVEGRKGSRAWKDEQIAEGRLAGLMPADKLYKPRVIVSPAEAEKFFGGKKKKPSPHWADVMMLYSSAPGKPSVALGSDPRPSWSGEAKAEEFAGFADADGPTA